MNSSKSLFRFTQLLCQASRTNASTMPPPSSKFARLKKLQEHLGLDDGVLVHVKNGAKDKILVTLTAGLVAVGTAAGLQVFYQSVIKG